VIVMAYKDNRNWAIYNERLVRRVILRFGVSWWDRELKKMNREKRGRPFLHYGIEHSQFANSRIWGMTAGGRNMDMVEDELWISSQL